MAYEPYLVAPYENSGLKKWFKPWIIGRTAFPIISDAYPRRGVIRKREGTRLLASFPAGDKPVQGLKNWVNPNTLGESLIAFSRTKSYVFNDGTQAFNDITHLSDTTAFTFGNGTNDYFWSCNFAGSMWVANGLGLTTAAPFPTPTNGIFYLTNNGDNAWNIHQPQVDGTPTYLNGCLIILPYKGRLVTLNTIEGNATGTTNTPFSNRARWSQLGTPYVDNAVGGHSPVAPSPFAQQADAWRSDIPGKGGFIDADTSERIVSAAIIRDTLIVHFQRSTWRLTYTGNEVLPFIWERINTQYGSESTYSTVAFDDADLTFSRYGWISSTTNEVNKIDLDIPDDSFAIEGTNIGLSGLNKVQGIRDFYRNFAYFTYIPMGQTNATQIYAYNYIDHSWTIFNPTNPINVFGNYRNTVGDFTWSTFNNPGPNPQKDSWENYNSPDDTWSNFGAGQNIDFPYTLGGDINGNVYLMFEFFQAPTSDNGTAFNFNITTKRDNPYYAAGMRSKLAYVDIYSTTFPGGEITLQHFVDDEQSPVMTKTVEIFSRGVVSITGISVGTTTTITTATDHNLTVGEFVSINDIVGSVGRILNGKSFVVGTAPTTTTFTITDDTGNNINTSGTAYGSQGYIFSQDLVQGDANYTRVFLGSVGRLHQISLSLSDNQLSDPVKGVAQFELQAMVFWFRKMGRIKR